MLKRFPGSTDVERIMGCMNLFLAPCMICVYIGIAAGEV